MNYMQHYRPLMPFQKETLDAAETYISAEEGTLYLSITTPSKTSSKPVMVWLRGRKLQNFLKFSCKVLKVFWKFHGGGWFCGAAQEYDSTPISAFGDVVVVNLSYRLGKSTKSAKNNFWKTLWVFFSATGQFMIWFLDCSGSVITSQVLAEIQVMWQSLESQQGVGVSKHYWLQNFQRDYFIRLFPSLVHYGENKSRFQLREACFSSISKYQTITENPSYQKLMAKYGVTSVEHLKQKFKLLTTSEVVELGFEMRKQKMSFMQLVDGEVFTERPDKAISFSNKVPILIGTNDSEGGGIVPELSRLPLSADKETVIGILQVSWKLVSFWPFIVFSLRWSRKLQRFGSTIIFTNWGYLQRKCRTKSDALI